MDTQDTREIIKDKLRQNFAGKIVRKDLTKKIKEGANVPVYVLEFLLGQYCSSDDPELIEKGVESVKHILADNFVRPDEAQKILSQLRQRGNYTVIDSITVKLDIKKDAYFEQTVLTTVSDMLYHFPQISDVATFEDYDFVKNGIARQYLNQYNATYPA